MGQGKLLINDFESNNSDVMSNNEAKQIEEMAQTIADFVYKDCNEVPFDDMRAVYDSVCRANVVSCMCCKIARGLTAENYRKQSDGAWIPLDNFNGKTTIVRCSNCDTRKGLAAMATIEAVTKAFPYCEKCGAKMKGGE